LATDFTEEAEAERQFLSVQAHHLRLNSSPVNNIPDKSGEFLHKEITQQIIGAAFEVDKHMGYGYLEKVYQRALQVELLQRGLKPRLEHPIQVLYKGVVVGDYAADLFVEDRVMVELKVAPEYCSSDEAQLLNELVSTGIKVGLLINFGRERVEFARRVH
jgi:GxxExxY protein